MVLKKVSDSKPIPALRETVTHGLPEYPIKIYNLTIPKSESSFVQQHWHPEIELVLVQEGSAVFHIGNQRLILNASEGLFINAGTLHAESGLSDSAASISYILFLPSMIAQEGTRIYSKYIQPILNDDYIPYIKLLPQNPAASSMLHLVRAIITNETSNQNGHELTTFRYLLSFWSSIISITGENALYTNRLVGIHQERIKTMISYINEHYGEDISLDDIALAANISSRECQRCFKSKLSITPFDYLKGVRLEAAARILRDTNDHESLASVALSCGFNDSSYFSKCFLNAYGVTPRNYRRQYLLEV